MYELPVCLDINECVTENVTCVHGTCVDEVNNFNCTCEKGWESIFCEISMWINLLILNAYTYLNSV